ncbi:MAG: hypothetical protein SGJ09_10555 [Phycisphaerae bacterium]|nr:hypothetical protein [Phycisphaerae bacterium]
MNIQRHNPVSATKPVQAIQAPVKKADSREVVSSATADVTKPTVENPPASAGHSRLEAFGKKIESRFENAMSSNNLSPRQQEALENERDRLHSMLARFEAAYMDGSEGGKMDTSGGMQKLLAEFAKNVNHIVGGTGAGAPTDKRVELPTTLTQRGSGSNRGGIDIVG